MNLDSVQANLWEFQVQQFLLALQLQHSNPTLCQEYQEAKQFAPLLVASETPAWMFVLREAGSIPAAAERLCHFWKTRKMIFGPQRWLKPLNLTGTGAMSPEDIDMLRSGFLLPLTKPTGEAYVVIDFSLLPEGTNRRQPRCYFYVCWARGRQSPRACVEGCTIVLTVKSGQAMPDFEIAPALADIRAFPVPVLRSLIVQACEPGKEILMEYLGYQQQLVINTKWPSIQTQLITGQSTLEIRHKVAQALGGIGDGACLPPSLGGTLDVDSQIKDWFLLRLSFENPGGASTSLSQGQVQESATSEACPKEEEKEEEDLETQRQRRNAYHSRKSYYKKQAYVEDLKNQVADLRAEKSRLSVEHDRLMRLWTDVQTLLGTQGVCLGRPR